MTVSKLVKCEVVHWYVHALFPEFDYYYVIVAPFKNYLESSDKSTRAISKIYAICVWYEIIKIS